MNELLSYRISVRTSSVNQVFETFFECSGTPLIRTPMGQKKVWGFNNCMQETVLQEERMGRDVSSF